ncbi:MAG: glutathione S-transferase family protein [Myxococcota bacterium]
MPTHDLIIHGVPFSQPVRAVLWLLVHKRRPFQLELTNPGAKGERGSRNPAYLALNPAGTVPVLREPETGFVLAEANAIMAYLCQRHGWTDMYPEDLHQRAKVDWYLHYHHRAVRPASTLVARQVRKDLHFSDDVLAEAERSLTRGLKVLNEGWLAGSRFLAGEEATIADLAAYAEIGQLQPEFTALYDVSSLPHVERWLTEMKSVAGHDVVHVVMSELGDLSGEAPTFDALKAANVASLRALKAELETFTERDS